MGVGTDLGEGEGWLLIEANEEGGQSEGGNDWKCGEGGGGRKVENVRKEEDTNERRRKRGVEVWKGFMHDLPFEDANHHNVRIGYG